ncbi:glutamyl-tRNA reductase [Furfurilactobacillus siliginis]|nr:glutamyl-tRNA reductase [Furfurilactobacillus siliginis]KRN96200.1 glutamyl-tRNA reductase [Furfurilactobacillus siliginis]
MYASLNYHELPVQERAVFALDKESTAQADLALKQEKSVLEDVILSTCNRTEIYAVVDQLHTGKYYLKRFLANQFGYDLEKIEEIVEIGSGEEATTHLLRVTTGLDSMIVGEPQILGQMKNAFAIAQEQGTSGLIFNELFKEALTFAKRMHTKHRVSELSQSSAQAGLHQIKVHLGTMKGHSLLVLGVGSIGQQVIKNASTMGFDRIIIANRTFSRAAELAKELGGVVEARQWDEMDNLLTQVDAVVTAVSSSVPIINELNSNKLQVLIDLGVPQNVSLKCVRSLQAYYNIDDLSNVVSQNNQIKKQMIVQMESAVPEAVQDFEEWQRALPVVPIIRELRGTSLSIESNAYESLLNKLPQLDEHERKVISKHMKSIVNQMIKGPIVQIKDASGQPGSDEHLAFFCRIFGFSEDSYQGVTHEK